jgi:transposase
MGTTEPLAATQVESVRALLIAMHERGEHAMLVETALRLIEQLASSNDELARALAKAMRRAAGHRSEKLDPRQLLLEIAKLTEEEQKLAPPVEPPPMLRRRQEAGTPRRPRGRQPLPADLPRERQRIAVAEADRHCAHGEMKVIGVETSEVLEFEPGKFKVIVFEREKRACPKGECGVERAAVADKVIERGLPGPGLLAQVLVGKYRDHLPLHRQSGIFARAGVTLSDSTLGDWIREVVELGEPLADAIFKQRVLPSHVMQGDDTGLRVLDPSEPGGVKKGHLWAFVGDRRWAAFRYTETWKGEEARRHVGARKGWMQVDGYAGFDVMFRARDPAGAPIVVEVGCWSHARRGLVEALDGGDARAAVPLAIIAKLFAVEHDADASNLDHEARLALRQQRSRPIRDELWTWIELALPSAPPKTPLGKAIGYLVNQWRQLGRFLEDGRIELTNNAAERALRAVAVGRKNWMFAGSEDGARRAAVAYTIIGTCVLGGVDPFAYLRDVLFCLARRDYGDIADLFPDAWADRKATNVDARPAAIGAAA